MQGGIASDIEHELTERSVDLHRMAPPFIKINFEGYTQYIQEIYVGITLEVYVVSIFEASYAYNCYLFKCHV